MGRIWAMCCDAVDVAPMRAEIAARDAGARFLRLGDPAAATTLAQSLPEEAFAAALKVRDDDAERAEQVVGDLARTGATEEIVVFIDSPDAGVVARLFYAGATEVIAAEGANAPHGADRISKAGMGEETVESSERDGARRDDVLAPGASVPQTGARGLGAETNDETGASEVARGAQGDSALRRDVTSDASAPAPAIVTLAATGGGAAPRGSYAEAPDGERGAPLVAIISGRGGVGKTSIAAAMAAAAARTGLRAAVLDFDLMFGNLHAVLGVDSLRGLEPIAAHATGAGLAERDIEAAAMRIGPGLTLWGPCAAPEQAELLSKPAEQLVGVLRGLADVIVVDTSVFWGDAAAMAVAACDRCLVVGADGASSVPSAKKAIALAAKLGVPRTRMTGVFNAAGARGDAEERALHFEMGVSLRSHARVADGGDEAAGLLSLGRVDRLIAGDNPFARSMRALSCKLLRELGCPVDQWLLNEEGHRAPGDDRPRIRLPWARQDGGGR